MSTTPEKPAAPIAALNPDVSATPRLSLLVALAQPGKPLRIFWENPSQGALTVAVARIAFAMAKAGKSEGELTSVLTAISATNASALRQVFEAKITLPRGTKSEAVKPTADLAALGL